MLSGCRPMVVTGPSSISRRPSLLWTMILAMPGTQDSNTLSASPLDPRCIGFRPGREGEVAPLFQPGKVGGGGEARLDCDNFLAPLELDREVLVLDPGLAYHIVC